MRRASQSIINNEHIKCVNTIAIQESSNLVSRHVGTLHIVHASHNVKVTNQTNDQTLHQTNSPHLLLAPLFGFPVHTQTV